MSKMTIVCVDDQQVILDCLQMQLERYYGNDYRLEFVNSGHLAISTIESVIAGGIDKIVIICDLNLGTCKGDAILAAIHDKYPETGKILLSGYAPPALIDSLKERVNLNGYVYKPWDRHELIRVIDTTVCEIMGWNSSDRSCLDVNKTAILCVSDNSRLEQALNESLSVMNCTLSFVSNASEAVLSMEQLALEGVRHLVIVSDWGIEESELIIDARSQFLSVNLVVMDGNENKMNVNNYIKGVQLAGGFDSNICIDAACKVIRNAVNKCVPC